MRYYWVVLNKDDIPIGHYYSEEDAKAAMRKHDRACQIRRVERF